ncbi:Lrp/AsnC family transcriptional regulator [Microvirga puerhi]|uniref:Lrp/AsnC family transcriptional regulator n=1 Tax=Microvirga puerhi TaxID=2876078 RepID=A0ABS7VIP7_9HYPH|nr:Lrp/AsnC family transcriptional regulator [Microvirga puerhi]MBZ6075046.1 Lrp/AsnC family transcriptional regulator [Microvirga puerhi]
MKPEAKPPPNRTRKTILDRIDLSILKAMAANGRMTYQALSERVGLSPRPCLERVRRLEERGVIRGYSAMLDPISLGHEIVAMTNIGLRDAATATRRRLEQVLCAHPAVIELQLVNGEYDYVARIVAPTLSAYESLTDGFLADPTLGIARIHTTFVLKMLKAFDGYPIPDTLG